MADMVMEASNVGGTTGGTRGVAGGLVEMASGIDGAVGPDGTNSAGSSSYCSAYDCTGDAGLGGTATGVE